MGSCQISRFASSEVRAQCEVQAVIADRALAVTLMRSFVDWRSGASDVVGSLAWPPDFITRYGPGLILGVLAPWSASRTAASAYPAVPDGESALQHHRQVTARSLALPAWVHPPSAETTAAGLSGASREVSFPCSTRWRWCDSRPKEPPSGPSRCGVGSPLRYCSRQPVVTLAPGPSPVPRGPLR
jgi:hypothetical protein